MTPETPCPCGSGRPLAACCGRYHAGALAENAEILMRSRYTAYVLGDEAYLLATWHPDTRPASLDLDQEPPVKWLGLTVKRHQNGGDGTAQVEFVARWKGPGHAQRMHEISRFLQVDGRWYYLNAQS